MAASAEGTGTPEVSAGSKLPGKKRKQFKPVASELLGFRSAGEAPDHSCALVLKAVCDIVGTVVAKQQRAVESPDIEARQSLDITTQDVLARNPYLGDNLPLLNAAFDLLCLEHVLQTGDRRGHRQRWCWFAVENPQTILFNYKIRLNNENEIVVSRFWQRR